VPDEREGDELFEDLDKFFAPIRDVDWEDDDAPKATTPSEGHVEVRPAESPVAAPPEPPAAAPAGGDLFADAEDDDDDWYAEEVGAPANAGAGDDLDDLAAEDDDATTLLDPVVIVGDDAERDDDTDVLADDTDVLADGEGSDAAQPDLFEDEDVAEPEPAWALGDDDAAASSPSEEDLEAAAAHFAGSLREGATYETAPIDVMDEGSDLLADLGAPEAVEEDILGDLEEPAAPPKTVVVGGEGISGPSWQDVAAVEVGADLDRRGPGTGERDVPAAFMTGVVLAALSLGALWLGEGAFAVVATLAVLVAQGELFGVMVRHHFQPATAVGLAAGALMMAGAYWRGEAATLAMFALGMFATFLWYMTVPASVRKDILRNVGLTVLNMAWIPLLAGYLIATLKLEDGPELVVAVIGLTFLYDTTAFLVGSVWGGSFFQRALAPSVSPKKSIEGLIGATLVTVVASVALVPSFVGPFEDKRLDALLLALVIAIAATMGDLAESLVKRDLQIKDMGSLLPGHGGVLDRIDSLLFVAPAAFLLFRVVL
jgi:phosphatidate cytidylyltransferase